MRQMQFQVMFFFQFLAVISASIIGWSMGFAVVIFPLVVSDLVILVLEPTENEKEKI